MAIRGSPCQNIIDDDATTYRFFFYPSMKFFSLIHFNGVFDKADFFSIFSKKRLFHLVLIFFIIGVWKSGALQVPKGVTVKQYLFSSGAKKAIFSWSGRNLVVALVVVQDNNDDVNAAISNNSNGDVVLWNYKLEWFSNCVKFTIWNPHAPN